MNCNNAGLYNIDDAPLDGGHIMIVFCVDGLYKIRESWANSVNSDLTWEYWSDDMKLYEIDCPLGWFPIPTDFNKLEYFDFTNM